MPESIVFNSRLVRHIYRHAVKSLMVGCGLLAVSALFAGETRITSMEDYLVKNLTTDEGLPMNQINYLDTSPKGFLWIGTFEGLVRYDGRDFESITHQDYPALKGGAFDVKIDRENTIWAFDTNHRFLFRYHQGELQHWETDHITNVVDYTLFVDWQGDVLFLGGSKFYRIIDNKIEEVHIPGLDGLSIHNALFAKDGSLWIADINRGIHQLSDGQTRSFDPTDYGAKSSRIVVLEEGLNQSIWAISSDNDLLHFDGNQWTLYQDAQLRQSGPTRALLAEANGSLWIGTQNGLFRFNQGRIEKLPDSPNQDADHVFSITQTPEGSIAYSTFNNGLKVLLNRVFKTYTERHGLRQGVSRCVIPGPDGGYYVGSTEGVAWVKPKRDQVEHIFPELEGVDITDIHLISEDHIFFSSYGQGLYEYHQGQIQRYTQAEGLASDTIYQMEMLPDGRLALGTYFGLSLFDGSTFENFSVENGLSSNIVLSLLLDHEHTLWLSMASGGLCTYREGVIEHRTADTDLARGTIFHLSITPSGEIWGGYSGGVIRILNNQVEALDLTGVFPRTNIFHVWNDQNDSLWLSSNSGLYRIQRADLLNLQQSKDIPFHSFLKTDGLPSNNVTALSVAHKDGSSFWVPFSGGIVKVQPERANAQPYRPTVFIDKVIANGKTVISHTTQNAPAQSFAPGLRYLRVSYTAPTYQSSDRVVFMHRLQGFEDWQISKGRESVYTNLPPGDYIFEVTTADRDSDNTIARFSFTVEPFFHQTMWFYVLAATGFLLIGYLINFLRLLATKRQQERMEKLVELRTQELRRQSEELTIAKEHAESANRLKSEFTANISHEIRTPMNSIMGFTDILRAEIDDPHQKDYLNTILKSGTTLMQMIDDLLDLSKIEANKLQLKASPSNLVKECRDAIQMFRPKLAEKKLELNFRVDPRIPTQLRIDPTRFRQVMLNLIGNAVKFTDEGFITVEIKLLKLEHGHAHVRCTVTDTGDGIPEHMLERIFNAFEQASRDFKRNETGSGLGLSISKRLVEMMKGTIRVQSVLGQGSTFTVEFEKLMVYDNDLRTPDQTVDLEFASPPPRDSNSTLPSREWLESLFAQNHLSRDDRDHLLELFKTELIPSLTVLDVSNLTAAVHVMRALNSSYQIKQIDELCELIEGYGERIDIEKSRKLRDLISKLIDTY